MAFDHRLAERIRELLTDHGVTAREVKMFGGLSFLVGEKLALSANTHGDLMVRCAPERVDELLTRRGAAWAEMRGKPMSRGWLRIDIDAVEESVDLDFWVTAALDHNRTATGEN